MYFDVGVVEAHEVEILQGVVLHFLDLSQLHHHIAQFLVVLLGQGLDLPDDLLAGESFVVGDELVDLEHVVEVLLPAAFDLGDQLLPANALAEHLSLHLDAVAHFAF